MLRVKALVCGFLVAAATAAPSFATVRINIDLSNQRMHVESAEGTFSWPVSTARSGYETPAGEFAPTGMERMHYSKKYDNAPMPYSIFFYGGYAIHGSYETRSLGRPASHGCVRLSPGHARRLYDMVSAEGATISITGTPPAGAETGVRSGGSRGARGYSGRPDASESLFPPFF